MVPFVFLLPQSLAWSAGVAAHIALCGCLPPGAWEPPPPRHRAPRARGGVPADAPPFAAPTGPSPSDALVAASADAAAPSLSVAAAPPSCPELLQLPLLALASPHAAASGAARHADYHIYKVLSWSAYVFAARRAVVQPGR